MGVSFTVLFRIGKHPVPSARLMFPGEPFQATPTGWRGAPRLERNCRCFVTWPLTKTRQVVRASMMGLAAGMSFSSEDAVSPTTRIWAGNAFKTNSAKRKPRLLMTYLPVFLAPVDAERGGGAKSVGLRKLETMLVVDEDANAT